METKKGQKRGK